MKNICCVILNEIRKELLLVWSYRIQWLCEIFALLLFFFFLNRMNYPLLQDNKLSEISLISYATWFYAILLIGDMGGKLANEMRIGTFEQLCLSVISLPWILAARVLASLMRATLLFCLLIAFLTMLFSIHIPFQHMLLFFSVFLCLLPGLFGLSFLLGGITLLIKDAGPIVNIVNNSLLFLSGGFIPLDVFPGWMVSFAKHLPTTQAIKIFQSRLQNTTPFFNEEIFKLILHSLFYLAVGLFTFWYCEKKAKLLGTLSHY